MVGGLMEDDRSPEPAASEDETEGAAASESRDRPWILKDVRASARGIVVVLTLVAVQQIAWLVEPAVFGTLMDAVTDEARTLADLVAAMPLWALVFATNTLAGSLRRIASERVYGRMYARVAQRIAERAASERLAPTQTAARAELARDFVEFFEDRLPDAILGAVSLVGALGALFSYDPRIGAACLGVLAPLVVIGRAYDRRVSLLTAELHELREQNVEMFAGHGPDEVLAHFTKIAELKRRIGSWSAFNFGALRSALLVVFVVVLYVAIDVDDLTVGAIYAIVTYLWTFVTAIEDLPELLENMTAVRDITRRLQGKPLRRDATAA